MHFLIYTPQQFCKRVTNYDSRFKDAENLSNFLEVTHTELVAEVGLNAARGTPELFINDDNLCSSLNPREFVVLPFFFLRKCFI